MSQNPPPYGGYQTPSGAPGHPGRRGPQGPAHQPTPGNQQWVPVADPFEPPQGKRKGFFGTIFDFSFATVATPRFVKIFYPVVVMLLLAVVITFIIAAFIGGGPPAIVGAIVSPIAFFFIAIALRLVLELFLHVSEIAEAARRQDAEHPLR